MDLATRKVLSWRVPADFCIEALEEALTRHEPPEIFDTDRGGEFARPRFTGVLQDAGVRSSMAGRGRRTDDVFIERLGRGPKHERVCPHAFEAGSELRARAGNRLPRRPPAVLGLGQQHAARGLRGPGRLSSRGMKRT